MPKLRIDGSPVGTVSSTVPTPVRRPLTSFGDPRASELEGPDTTLLQGRVVAVDPGLTGTGVAVFEDGVLTHAAVHTVPNRYGKANWATRADLLVAEIVATWQPSEMFAPWTVVCEMMEYQGAGARGLGWRSGDMARTVYFIGLLAGRCHPARFIPVPVHQWKGQLPKKIVEERLVQRLGATRCRELALTSHAWDAVGIGMWAMGKF